MMIDKKMIRSKIRDRNFDDIFVIDYRGEYTYRQIYTMAIVIVEYLKKQPGEEYIVIMDNSLELLVMYFACLFGNKEIIPIDPFKSESEIMEIKKLHQDAKEITREEVGKLIGKINTLFYKHESYHPQYNKDINTDRTSNNTDQYSYSHPNKYPCNKIIKRTFKQAIYQAISQINFDKDYLITYTSGSTGEPKGVVHSAYNLFASGIVFGETLGYGQGNILGHCMPMTYMAGILNSIFLPYIMGSKIVILKRFSAQSAMEFWKQVRLYGINTFWFSPTMLHLLLYMDKNGEMKQYFGENKPIISVGTAPLDEELKTKFEDKYGVCVYQSYGLSETLFISSENPRCEGKKLSCGELLQYVDLQLLSDGEILVKTPWMLRRYTNQDMSEYIMAYLGELYYKTGDLGKLDVACLNIIGRKKDLIIKGGMNINPNDIMHKLSSVDTIIECYVSSVMVRGEEQIISWYVAEQDLDVEQINQINEMLIQTLGKNYKVDQFFRVDIIPKNLNGKVDKQKLVSRIT